MIIRYSRPEMTKIWSQENKYQIWFDIEIYALEALEKLGIAPEGTAKRIAENFAKSGGKFNVERIDEIEQTTKHDVIAFLTHLAELVGENSRFIHYGMTSSDVLDTCLSLQLSQASSVLIDDLEKVLQSLKKRAFEHKYTICVGRSHGIHAEPTTFGLKLARFYAEFDRNLQRLKNAQQEIAVCAISGAVGTHANISPKVQEFVAKKLNLATETTSSQVIPRDRHAMFFATLGVIASSIENIAIEIRHLQRTEVLEVEEFFSKGQKGSSAMPHKRNPVLSENLTGLARMVRSAVVPAMENVALWHERDISHSSVERMIAPDACVTLDFALTRLANLIENLTVYPQNMQKNLDNLGGLVFSQRVMLTLIDEAGISREEAYRIVQSNAMRIWRKEADNFLELLKQEPEVMAKLGAEKLNNLFDLSYHTKHVEDIFNAVFK
ncbi:MAG: adenylosuccinate lyase [Proteobacteria bacterium]|nr:adenylosuccinate lyase [Pseudomonadota bacterium]NCA28613.1 adenylosuccinate lyase [Pseudomonadota bacterium]